MKKISCPCCTSTLRSKQRKTKLKRLLYFVNFYKCAKCHTSYTYVKGIHKTLTRKNKASKK